MKSKICNTLKRSKLLTKTIYNSYLVSLIDLTVGLNITVRFVDWLYSFVDDTEDDVNGARC